MNKSSLNTHELDSIRPVNMFLTRLASKLMKKLVIRLGKRLVYWPIYVYLFLKKGLIALCTLEIWVILYFVP